MGFPTPAAQEAGGRIDLTAELVGDPASTYILRVAGNAMAGAGIFSGDEVVVERALPPLPGDTVVAIVGGEFMLRVVERNSRGTVLRATKNGVADIPLGGPEDAQVWGVVTWTLHRPRPAHAPRADLHGSIPAEVTA